MESVARKGRVQTAFVMMPFANDFDDVYSVVKEAVVSVDKSIGVVRLDEVKAAGSITEDMIEQIRRSIICVADVTGANPNVMWEVGYAAALGKPLVAINQQGSVLPFDIKDVRTLMYDRSSLSKSLRGPLVEALQATLERYISRRTSLAPEQQLPHFRAITVTGSTRLPRQRVAERLERVLSTYAGHSYHWYVGSFGDTDEAVLKFLIEAGESSIAVVGHYSYDISPGLLAMLEERKNIAFVDAAREQIPHVPGASSRRDVLFAVRSDLLVVMWDGSSTGTGRLLNWLDAQEKDHVIGFVTPPHV